MSVTEFRAQFDAIVSFSNGGGLRTDGFRADVPGPDVTQQDVASFFIASLNLLMVDSVELRNLRVLAEPLASGGEPRQARAHHHHISRFGHLLLPPIYAIESNGPAVCLIMIIAVPAANPNERPQGCEILWGKIAECRIGGLSWAFTTPS
jgi:hypothetical protein